MTTSEGNPNDDVPVERLKARRGWRTAAWILSPLMIGLIWAALGRPEEFRAFVLGVWVSVLVAGVVFVRFLLKKTDRKHPAAHAWLMVASTVGIILVAGMGGMGATLTIYGDSDEATWGFTLLFMLFAPVALVTGITFAIRKYLKTRRGQ